MKKVRLVLIITLTICVIIFACIRSYKQSQVYQEYLAKKIYEIGETFTYVMQNNSLSAYYMICEPPSENDALIQMALQYINENGIVENLLNRAPKNDIDSLYITFVRPSKAFPIGWNSGESTGFLGEVSLDSQRIMSIRIPRDAHDQNEYYIVVIEDGVSRIINAN